MTTRRIAAITLTTAAFGGLAALALTSQPDAPQPASAAKRTTAATVPTKVTTEVVHRTVHVRAKSRPAAAPATSRATTATAAPAAAAPAPVALPVAREVGDDHGGRAEEIDDHGSGDDDANSGHGREYDDD